MVAAPTVEHHEGEPGALPCEAGRGMRRALHHQGSRARGDLADLIVSVLGWLLLLGFVTCTVAPGLTGDKVFLGTNVLSNTYPWLDTQGPNEIVNRGIGDTIDSVAPMSILIVDSVKQGSFAEWDPFNSGGTEAGALPNSALFSPLSVFWWILDPIRAPAATKMMEILAISLGMYLLLRRQWELPRTTAPLAAIVYSSSGFMIAWTNWPQTRVAAMIPLLFWAVDRLAMDPRLRNSVIFGGVLACMLLGGFPAVTAIALYTAIVYFFVRCIAARQSVLRILGGFGRSVLGGAIAFGLSAVQLLPFVWFATHYVDFDSRQSAKGWHLPFVTLATTVVPHVLGLPSGLEDRWPTHFVEGFSYIGVAAVGLMLAAVIVVPRARLPRGVLWFFAGSYLVWMSSIYFGGPILEVIQYLPAMGTSLIGRARSIVGFLAAVLAALGVAVLFDARPLRVPVLRRGWAGPRAFGDGALRAGLGVSILVPILIAVWKSLDTEDALYVQKWTLVALVIAAAVGVGALMVWLVPSKRGWAALMVVALAVTAVSAIDVARKWWPLSASGTFYPDTETTEYLSEHIGQDRYVSVGTLTSGTSSAYALRSLTGHGFTIPQWHSLLLKFDPDIYQSTTYTDVSSASMLTSVNSSILDRLGVHYFVLGPAEAVPGEIEGSIDASSGQVSLSSGSEVARSAQYKGPVRAVKMKLLSQSGLPQNATRFKASVVGADGRVLAATETRITGMGADPMVALDGDEIPADTAWHLEVSILDAGVTLNLAATESGDLAVSLVRPENDGLDIVHTGDSTIIENAKSLGRIRWASQQQVITDEKQRINAMADPATGTHTVILENREDLANVVDPSSHASVSSTDVDTNTISISANSSGPGWVVIADAMRGNGWSATIDGKPTEMVDAEEAGVAIHVSDSGSHTIVLRYNAPYFRAGGWVTLATASGILLLGVGSIVRSTRKQRASAHGASGSHGRS